MLTIRGGITNFCKGSPAIQNVVRQGTGIVKSKSCPTIRSMAVLTPRAVIDNLDLTKAKVQRVGPKDIPRHLTVPLEAPWEGSKPSKITILPISRSVKIPNIKPVHLYFGGLPALMAAARQKTENPNSFVTYVSDGKIAKSIQSGHQAHNHPTEFVAEDCSKKNLIKTMARGMGLLPSPDPKDLKKYSYLHFPDIWPKLFANPSEQLSLYAKFFTQRVLHDITARNGVSTQDRWLCNGIERSLDFHEELSKKIEAKTGLKTLKRDFRIYWSLDHEGIAKKKKDWTELGIKCEMMSKEEVAKRTLLRLDQDLAVLKIYGDGQFEPDTPNRIVDYFKGEHPTTFNALKGEVSEVYINTATNKPEAVKIIGLDGAQILPVKSVYGSPGHDQVYKYDPSTKVEQQLYKSVPVSGISSLWKCTIPRRDLEIRWNLPKWDNKALKRYLDKVCASANLCNLHNTIFDTEIYDDVVHLFARVSQGANFDSNVADKNDLENITTNLDRFFIGDWRLQSVGTCTRQSGVTNAPTLNKVNEVVIAHGFSGLGYSASGMDLLHSPKPSLFEEYLTPIERYSLEWRGVGQFVPGHSHVGG